MSRKPLLPDGIAKTIPALYSQEHVADPIVHAKFFHPLSNWTWYLIEIDPAERLCFGLVDGFDEELGNFSLDELEGVEVRGLGIEQDEHWTPRPLSQCRKQRR